MKYLFTIVLLVSSSLYAYDYVDLVGADGVLYVAWGEHLQKWNTSTEIAFESSCSPSLGLATLNGEEVLLYTRCHMEIPDSLYILDRVTLDIIASREILPEHLANLSSTYASYSDLMLARYQPEEDIFYLSSDPSVICSGNMENNAVSARLEYDLTNGIVITDTLGYGNTSYVGSYSGLTGPVFCGTSLPMIFWGFYGSYFSSSLSERAAIHVIDGDPVEGNYEPILTSYIYTASGSFTPGGIKCSGASSDEVVVLWTKENNSELSYSVYDCTGPVELVEELMVNPPISGNMMSLSRNPSDEGMLLVWEDGNEIRCRYRDGEWNPFSYTVESINETPIPGSLKVCSVSDGYWVSWWISGESTPEIRFVPRETVSSIEEQQQGESAPVISISPNPCSSSASIEISGITNPGSICVYDIEGRLVGNLEINENSTALWNTENICQGTYFVRMATESSTAAVKVLVMH